MKRASFHPEAEAEFLHAASFYENKSTGLGQRFVDEIERAVEQIEGKRSQPTRL